MLEDPNLQKENSLEKNYFRVDRSNMKVTGPC